VEYAVGALNLDQTYVNSLIEKDRDKDRRKFEKWLSEPIEMYYVIRIIPAIYISYNLPTNINSEDEAFNFVAGIARERYKKCCLVLSRKEKIFLRKMVRSREGLRLGMLMRVILI